MLDRLCVCVCVCVCVWCFYHLLSLSLCLSHLCTHRLLDTMSFCTAPNHLWPPQWPSCLQITTCHVTDSPGHPLPIYAAGHTLTRKASPNRARYDSNTGSGMGAQQIHTHTINTASPGLGHILRLSMGPNLGFHSEKI